MDRGVYVLRASGIEGSDGSRTYYGYVGSDVNSPLAPGTRQVSAHT